MPTATVTVRPEALNPLGRTAIWMHRTEPHSLRLVPQPTRHTVPRESHPEEDAMAFQMPTTSLAELSFTDKPEPFISLLTLS